MNGFPVLPGIPAFLAAPDLGDYVVVVLGILLCLAPTALIGYIGLDIFVLGPRHRRRQAVAEEDRQQLMWAFARSLGWSWQKETTELNSRWRGAWFLERSGPNAKNVLRGRFRGRAVMAFDYSYVVDDIETPTRHEYSGCALELPSRFAPLLIARRWGLGPMIAVFVPIGLWMPVPAFRRRFRVKAADRAQARRILTAGIQRMLAARADVSLVIEGADLMCWTEGRQSTQQILDRLNLLADVADATPAGAGVNH